MDISPHFHRALVLHGQGRHELAEQELRQHLAAEPGDGRALAILAMCLLEQEKFDAAEQAARDSVGRLPDLGLGHYVLARVLNGRRHSAEAAAAIAEAIRLDPSDPDFHAMQAVIAYDRRRWPESLAAAEAGLRLDPEHVAGNNIRAMALVKLGRAAEAGRTISSTLARAPDDAITHANQGWALLEQGRRREAMVHFRESLRLDPTGDWARAGLVEAIKAGNPLYALLLKYFLWTQKLGPRAQWGILLGGFFGDRILADLATGNPDWASWVNPIRVAYVCFAILTWLAAPLFNLLLFLHPFGRHALSDDQRGQAISVGSSVLLAATSLAVWLVTGRAAPWLLAAMVFGLLSMPISAVFNCQRGWPRWTMAAAAAALAAIGIVACGAAAMLEFGNPADARRLLHTLRPAMKAFVPGIVASQFLANWLVRQRPRR